MLNPQVFDGESLRSGHNSPSRKKAEFVFDGAKLSSLHTSMLGADLRLNQSSAGKVMRSPFSSRLASSFEDTTAPAFGCIDSLGRLPDNAGVTFGFHRLPGLHTPFAACRTHTDRRRVVSGFAGLRGVPDFGKLVRNGDRGTARNRSPLPGGRANNPTSQLSNCSTTDLPIKGLCHAS